MKLQTEHKKKLKVDKFMSSPVVTAQPDTHIGDALQIMLLRAVGNLVVVDGEKIVGILTERELLQYLALNKGMPNKELRYVLTQKFTKVTPDTDITEAAKIMISKKARLLVFQKDKLGSDHLVGIITASDILRAFLKTSRNPSIEDTMTNKVFAVTPDSTVLSAVKLMIKKGIGSVVVGVDSQPRAIFTERDVLNKVVGEHADIEERVGAFCSYPVLTGKLGISAKEAGKLMIKHKIKRLPLVRGGEIVAVVTARDLVEAYQRGSK
jgi:CBS domain-containing protein